MHAVLHKLHVRRRRVITRKWCSLAVVYGQMYLKSVTMSSFGHDKKNWSRLSDRDKFEVRMHASGTE